MPRRRKKEASIPFDPKAWLRDTRRLPLEIRAIWIDLLCLMHESEPRGYLVDRAGAPLTSEAIAPTCGCSAKTVRRALQTLVASGVASTTEAGVVFSRRMVRETKIRETRSAAGKRGGDKTADLLKQVPKQMLKQSHNPSETNGLPDRTAIPEGGVLLKQLLKQNPEPNIVDVVAAPAAPKAPKEREEKKEERSPPTPPSKEERRQERETNTPPPPPGGKSEAAQPKEEKSAEFRGTAGDDPRLWEVARGVVKHYDALLRPPHLKAGGVEAAMQALQAGHSTADLRRAVDGYAAWCGVNITERKAVRSARTFFTDGYLEFLSAPESPPTEGLAARTARLAAEAEAEKRRKRERNGRLFPDSPEGDHG